MMIFDSHCHLNLNPLHENWQDHKVKANESGVKKMFIPGTNLNSSKLAIQVAETDEDLFAGCAIHPGEIDQDSDVELMLEKLEAIISRDINIVTAIGETGLDYYWLKDDESKQALIEKQQALFRGQLQMAVKHNMPVSIHVRDRVISTRAVMGNAYWDVIRILKEFSGQGPNFVLHCALGPIEYIDEAVKLGGYLGFAGNITYPKADDLRTLLAAAPKNRIMAETDAPYLPPQEFRGKICEPWMIIKTVDFLQAEIGIEPELLFENANKFFTGSD